MKKLLSCLQVVIVLICLMQQSFAQTNLARITSASVNTSFVSGWESLPAVNDGLVNLNSRDRTNAIYGNWNGEGDYGKYNWIEYSWNFANQIDSIKVYWFTDDGGLLAPSETHIEYWDGLQWINAGTIGAELDKYNKKAVNFKTRKLRLYMKSETSTGVIEYEAYGAETTDCSKPDITPYITKNEGTAEQVYYVKAAIGDAIKFTPQITSNEGDKWKWSGPNSFTSQDLEITLSNVQESMSGTYSLAYVNSCGFEVYQNFVLTVLSSEGSIFTKWQTYNPTISYDFRKTNPNFEMPTKNLYDGCSDTAWTYSDRWWTFVAGKKAKKLVTLNAVKPLLERLNDDFAFMRDSMGWPPDKLARNGYRSTVYLFGSGLCSDTEDSTALGGWQAGQDFQGTNYPIILASYYPIYSFDPACTYEDKKYQTGGMVHEGIHALLASMGGCKDAAWIQESGNTWLQMTMELKRSKTTDYSNVDLDWLSMGSVLAPFIPIEVYSGWLQDGSFGGPGGQGTYSGQYDENGTQKSITRNIIGGIQYSKMFPTFLGEIIGEGSNPWVWTYCPKLILQGIADSIGGNQVSRMIREYRARLALSDLGRFSNSVLKLYKDFMGTDIHSEYPPYLVDVEHWKATPYVKTTKGEDNYLIPEERTLPGWTGANIIPIQVNASKVVVDFKPIGENLSCQLCYRTKNGETVYGEVVYGGECVMNIPADKLPANNVVFAVICNTTFVYQGEETRHAKYNYRLKLIEGVKGTVNVDMNWWDWTQDITDPNVGINDKVSSEKFNINIVPNPAGQLSQVKIEFNNVRNENVTVSVSNLIGQSVYQAKTNSATLFIPENSLKSGMYIVSVSSSNGKSSKKLVIK